MKKRIILSAILTMLLCFCLIGGATFALFTSESEVNIAVTSGKVKVEAKIENKVLYSMDVKQNDKFENGGTAAFNENYSSLTLTNITPGDKITFDVVVTNSSNITIQYRVNWYVDGVLSEALVATADGEELIDGQSKWRKWDIPASGKDIKVIPVAIELPVEVGNYYQEKSAEIMFTVEAVQANASDLYDLYNCDVIATPETLTEVLANATEGMVIGLDEGVYDEIVVPKNNITLFSNQTAEVGFLNLDGHDNVTAIGLVFNAVKAKPTYKTSSGKSTATGYVANVTGDTSRNYGADNFVIKNCIFQGTYTGTEYFAPIHFAEGGAQSRATNMTVEGNQFNVTSAFAMLGLHYMGVNGEVIIENNSFNGKCSYIISGTGNSSDMTIKNNDLKGWTSALSFSSDANKCEWNFVNNKISAIGDFVVYSKPENVTVSFDNNEVPNGKIESYKDGNYLIYTVKLNDGVVVVEDASALTSLINTSDIIVLANDIDLGSTQLAINSDVVIDLNGKTLTTQNNYGGITIKGGASIKNGTINHKGNTAAIKAFQVGTIEDVVINVAYTEGKVKGGIVVQNGAETYIDSLKNVTINGATNGIETYNCGNTGRAKKVIGSMENVTIDALDTGILLSAPIGEAKNCNIKGEKIGINMHLKGEYTVEIELVDCVVTGETAALYAHDEVNISNITNCSLTLTYDANTSFNGKFVWEFEEECLGVVTLNKPA